MVIDSILGARIVYVLGIVNIVGILLVFFTCRCNGTWRLTRELFNYPWYQRLYSKHCLYWWIFIISVLLHATFAMLVFGNPF